MFRRTMELRPYQTDLDTRAHAAWNAGARNVMVVLACGGGKSAIAANIINKHPGVSVAMAHRQELVGQMSRTLGRYGIRHRIVGPRNLVKNIIASHMIEFGRDFYDPQARVAVASVDTIVSWTRESSKNRETFLRWAKQVTLWFTDEAHHLIRENKWGKAVELFPNAIGLGVTATPERADGKGLGRHADGFFDVMIEGPSMRDLIGMGYLTDYRVFCPPSDLDLSVVGTGTDGDYVRKQLAFQTQKSSIMGHVVEHYLKIAPGKLGVTFSPDVETATIFTKLFNEAGVPAELVTAQTPDRVRTEILKRFSERRLLQLVSVDIFSEGFDLPAIEVVSLARATQSYGLHIQQFGRGSRLLEGKTVGIVIDHVGNVLRHGLPDRPRTWSLDRRERRTRSTIDPDVIPMRVCTNPVCMAPYEAVHPACPFCGQEPVRAQRNSPDFIDGDLYELDAATLAAMRGEIARIERDPDAIHQGLLRAGEPAYVARAAAARHGERLRAQGYLKDAIALWAGYRYRAGDTDRMAYRRFYHQFGCDVLTAQTLGRADAETLALRLYADMWRAVR